VAETTELGLYLHIPFCTYKCHYCDFNSYAGLENLIPDFTRALVREVASLPQALPDESSTKRALSIRTINFGGGTPSLMPARDLENILTAVYENHLVPSGIETSLEANPGTVAAHQLRELRDIGFNRISFGVQSFDQTLLTDLGRIHSPEQAEIALDQARDGGFQNVNLDFIYGLPGQSLDVWSQTLERAIAIRPEHLSLYSLQVEPGTPYHQRWQDGDLPVPPDDSVADMYDLACQVLAAAGYDQYEVSNWAIDPAFRCQHNLIYWRNEQYLGVGPGSHSHYGRRRYWNVRPPRTYIRQVLAGASPVQGSELIDPQTELAETAMLGLRLNDGLNLASFAARFGRPVEAFFSRAIKSSLEDGLLELGPTSLRLSDRGRPIGNEVFIRFMEEARQAV
jgi:oxygen-independent coproporphyrinogen III oxidase